MRIPRGFVLWCAFGSALLTVGCKGKSAVSNPVGEDKSSMQELADLYKYFQNERVAPPRRMDDLAAHEAALPMSWDKIKSGDIVIQFGNGLSTSEQAALTVLAYERKVETDSGQVLMQDGSLKTMTTAEFRAAAKAR